jgi:hypothetical protein
MFRNKTKALGRVAVAAALSVGLAVSAVSVASAVGTTANAITASSAPAAGSAGGSYSPSATATSGDKVVITLGGASTGCSLNGGKVRFTGAGTCLVDFNDAGNATFAAASPVHQSITVYAANTITASKAPATGSVPGSYSPSATATSGDKVVITLDATSKGCSLNGGGKVSFTGAGTCLVDFNDAGNGAFAAASQVQQSIIVGAAGHKAQAAITLTSIRGIVGHALTLTSSGGSGTGAVSYAVTSAGTAGCSISAGMLSATSAGTCTVTVTKAADTNYRAASSPATTVTFAQKATAGPRVTSFSGRPALIGKTVTFTIRGSGFAGVTVKSSNTHTILRMVRRSATLLKFTVTVSNRQRHTGIAKLVISNRYGTVVLWYSMKWTR